MNTSLVNQVLKQPQKIKNFSLADWDLFIRQARAASLLARLYVLIGESGLQDIIPERVKHHFTSALLKARRQQQQIYYEADQLGNLLSEQGIDVVFLKGAAYVLGGSRAKIGRTCTDIDMLVSKSNLAKVESLLCQQLWSRIKMEDYNQAYYRRWMHEIPPLVHMERKTILDIHHNILPLTAKVTPDADKLLHAKQSLDNQHRQYILSNVDRLLHSATHLFHEGEFNKGLRDLTDLHLLFIELSQQDDGFWPLLLARAVDVGLTMPLYLAVRYCRSILDTPFPQSFINELKSYRPGAVKQWLLDYCFTRVFVPDHGSCRDWRYLLSANLLYVRGHLLRMPLRLLMPHLVTKFYMRCFKKSYSG
jgi:hypothetical protein